VLTQILSTKAKADLVALTGAAMAICGVVEGKLGLIVTS